jgi:hypothetical protein
LKKQDKEELDKTEITIESTLVSKKQEKEDVKTAATICSTSTKKQDIKKCGKTASAIDSTLTSKEMQDREGNETATIIKSASAELTLRCNLILTSASSMEVPTSNKTVKSLRRIQKKEKAITLG